MRTLIGIKAGKKNKSQNLSGSSKASKNRII